MELTIARGSEDGSARHKTYSSGVIPKAFVVVWLGLGGLRKSRRRGCKDSGLGFRV